MLYQRPTFTVPASSGHVEKMKQVCAAHGHMDPLDRHGKCWRCGEKIPVASIPVDQDVHGNIESLERLLGDLYVSAMPSMDELAAATRSASDVAIDDTFLGSVVLLPVRGGFGDVIAFAERSIDRAMKAPTDLSRSIGDAVFPRETGE